MAGEEKGGKEGERKDKIQEKVLYADSQTFRYCICLSVCIMRVGRKWIAWCCHPAAFSYVYTRGFDPGGAVVVQ